jgi:hypothetical protein
LFRKPQKIETIKLNAELNRLLDEMDTIDTNSEEYEQLMTHLERINKLRTQERPQRVSRDTMLVVLGNLAGILVIVAFEQTHVMSSKALGFIPKARTP